MEPPVRVVDQSTINGLVSAVAETAAACIKLAGTGKKDVIDAIASHIMADGLYRRITDKRFVSYLSEGRKDKAPFIAEGEEFGVSPDTARRVLLLSDPVECTGELASSPHVRERGSMCLAALAPSGSVPRVYSGCRALKIVVPPDAPNEIGIRTPPGEIVRLLADKFGRNRDEIMVWILDREWNQDAIAEVKKVGAKALPIRAGDFEAHILAGRRIAGDRRIHVSYGIGGLPEGFIAAPFLRWGGARMLLLPDPKEHHRKEISESGFEEMLGQVYDTRTMISSDDCVLAIAGITDSKDSHFLQIVRGVRYCEDTQELCVSVFVASPVFESCRRFEVRFPSRITEMAA